MTETAVVRAPFKPQFIIVITASPARQYAIKALLGIVLIYTPLHVGANYAEAVPFFAARNNSKALVVIDGWSLDEKSMIEINSLKKDFPETRCLLLVESSKELAVSRNLNPDKVLAGSVTGNQFIDGLKKLIEGNGLGGNHAISSQEEKQ